MALSSKELEVLWESIVYLDDEIVKLRDCPKTKLIDLIVDTIVLAHRNYLDVCVDRWDDWASVAEKDRDHRRGKLLSCPLSLKHQLLNQVAEDIRLLRLPECHRLCLAVIVANQSPLFLLEARPEYCRVVETQSLEYPDHRATVEARTIFSWTLWTISQRWKRGR